MFLATIAPFFQGVVRYWQGDVRVSVRPRKLLLELGSVALLFLFVALNPYSKRCSMSATVFLSRSGRCAGRVPLSLLVFKLIRSGEEAAAQALQELPLPFQCRRVWWLLSGNKLSVEV